MSHCLDSFIIFAQNKQKIVIISFSDSIKTNLPIGKHTLHVFTWYFKQVFDKSLFQCFISVFVSIRCILCHF